MTLMEMVEKLRDNEFYTALIKQEKQIVDAVAHKEEESQFSYVQEELVRETYNRHCN